jgi:phage terminase large subunit-like protein
MTRAPEGEGYYWEPDSDIPYSGKWYYLPSPKRFPFEVIARKYLEKPEDADEYIMFAFERQYLLDMEATKGFNLKGEWLHQYPYENIDESWPVFMGIDYASTPDKLKHKSRDYFGLGIVRAIPGGGLVLIDGVRKHVSRPEALDMVMNLWQEYPTTSRIGVETIGKGEEFYTDLMLMNDVMGKSPPLMSIKHGRRSKGERFEGWLAPRFKNSQIWISDRPTPFLREFKNEWLGWPNSQHDDCLDGVYMAAQAAQYMMPSKAERMFKTKRKRSPYAALAR